VLPIAQTKSLRRSLKKILRASGALRDLDVLAKRYQKIEHKNAQNLVKALYRRRSRMHLGLAKLYLRMRRGDRIVNQSEKLHAKIKTSRTTNDSTGIWMKSRWSQIVEQFYESTAIDIDDLDALHRLRIRSKQMRYAFELLAPIFAPERREHAYEFVELIQDRLGLLHDHDIACKLFCDWESQRNRISRACNLKLLADSEKTSLERARTELIAWWTPALLAEMRHAFDQLTMLMQGPD
jgi:CHAD domain-containing protein